MTTIETNMTKSYILHQKLIEECKNMDQKAQFQIYKMYYKAMLNTIHIIVNDPLEAEEIIQESFLVAFERISTYIGSESFDAWLDSIVQNQLKAIRRNNRFEIPEEIGYSCEVAGDLGNNQLVNENFN